MKRSLLFLTTGLLMMTATAEAQEQRYEWQRASQKAKAIGYEINGIIYRIKTGFANGEGGCDGNRFEGCEPTRVEPHGDCPWCGDTSIGENDGLAVMHLQDFQRNAFAAAQTIDRALFQPYSIAIGLINRACSIVNDTLRTIPEASESVFMAPAGNARKSDFNRVFRQFDGLRIDLNGC